ncbi:MAG: hypothetical protein HFE73_00855 [Firmicutes bacterium]|nr:hypothetical protein [Bacillota bacterium]
MINQKRTGAGFLLAVLLLSCPLTGCHGASDASITEVDKAKATQTAEGLTQDQPQFFDIEKEQFKKMGEPVSGIDVQNGKAIQDALRYTVTAASLFDSFADAAIDTETTELTEAEEFLTADGQLKAGIKLMLLDLTVQNVGAEPKQNITALNILCGDSVSEEKGKASFFELYPSGPVWFSNPSGKRTADGWKEYYYYSLAVGQSKNLKAAWLIDTTQYDPQNLYLTFDYDEEQKYIKLEF